MLFWHCRRVHPQYTWSRKDVGSPKATSLFGTFHIGSTFCFFPANFMSSTYTDKNNPFSRCTKRHSQFGVFSQPCFNKIFSTCLSHNSPAKGWPYKFLSRGTTGSSILDHDLGHLCRRGKSSAAILQGCMTGRLQSLSTSETAASMLPVTSKPFQGARGFSHSAGSFRATRQRSTTRLQDTAAMLEETLSLFVEENWQERGFNETATREFHTKKEAWELFRRLPSFKPQGQEEFEEEFKRKVMTGCSSGSPEGREKYLDGWAVDLQKTALEVDRRSEARERATMGEEDSSSRKRTEWKRMLSLSPFPKAASWTVTSDATSSPVWRQL